MQDNEQEEEEFIIREYTSDDLVFVNNSLLMSYKDSSDFAKSVPKEIYFRYHHQVINNILDRASTKCFIACPETDHDLIYGYAVFETIARQNIFHYIYVKRAFCRFGLGEALMRAAPFTLDESCYASHMTHKGKKIIDKLGLIYCPYLL